MNSVRYAGGTRKIGPFVVKFKIKASGRVLEKGFYTMREADGFVNRIKHGKRCEVISCPSERR